MAFDSWDYHAPTTEQLEQIDVLRTHAKAMRSAVEALPQSRERSLALTNLEQSLMWACKAAIAPVPARAPA